VKLRGGLSGYAGDNLRTLGPTRTTELRELFGTRKFTD
jgi:hypothetical protein